MFVPFSIFQLKVTHLTDGSNIFACHMTMMSDLSSVNRKFTITRNTDCRCIVFHLFVCQVFHWFVYQKNWSNSPFLTLHVCKELIHHILTGVTLQLIVVIFKMASYHHAKTTGYVRVRIIVFLQERFKIGIYCKWYFKLKVILVEFYNQRDQRMSRQLYRDGKRAEFITDSSIHVQPDQSGQNDASAARSFERYVKFIVIFHCCSMYVCSVRMDERTDMRLWCHLIVEF